MAYTITVDDVRDVLDTGASDTNIRCLIDVVDLADECLDSTGVPLPVQKLAKTYAVVHILMMQQGGAAKSETDMDGESVTLARTFDKQGLQGTPYGQLLSNMEGYSCIANVIDRPRRSFKVVNSDGVRVDRRILVPRRLR